jgi:hypothetical protein
MFLEIEMKLLPPEWQWIVDRGRSATGESGLRRERESWFSSSSHHTTQAYGQYFK